MNEKDPGSSVKKVDDDDDEDTTESAPTLSDSAESFELVNQVDVDDEVNQDKQHNREIKDEGGALSVNPIEAVVKEKL